MLEPFKGELFIHPAALDYSGNTCSNACAYCFASLRAEARRAQVRKLSNLCLGKASGESHTDWLFYQGYPVCVSNRSDPFATSNRDNTGVVLQLLDLVPNGVFFQTKGLSKGVDYSLLDGFKKQNVVMYITMDTTDEAICKRIEPGAPLPKARIELARYAKSRGWEVIVGLNPLVKEWMPEADIIALEDELASFGVTNYLAMPLSLNAKDVAGMNPNRRAMFGGNVIESAVSNDDEWRYWIEQYWRMSHKPGIGVYSVNGWRPTHMDDAACARLGKHMNSVQHFVDFAWDENARSGRNVFTFSDFAKVMTDGNPEMWTYRHADLYKYIMCINRAVWKSGGLAKRAKSFIDVYRVLWNERRIAHSPQNIKVFTVVCDGEGKPVRDSMGDIMIAFLGGGSFNPRDRKAAMTAGELEGKGVKVNDEVESFR